MTTAHARIPGIPGTGDTHPSRAGWLRSFLSAHMLPVRPGQIVAWEVVIVTVALTFRLAGLAARIELAFAAVLVVGGTSVRVAGRHCAGWTLTWLGYRLLRHDDRKLAADPLVGLVPDFRLRQHADRAGHRFGIAGVGDGWSALVRVRGEPDPGTLLGLLREACEGEIPLASAQLTIRADGTERVHLVAVRFRVAEAPLAALSRGSGELGQLRATARAALGVVGALADAGFGGTVLEAGELAAEVRASLGVDPRAAASDGWYSWSAGEVEQAGFVAAPEALGTHARGADLTITSFVVTRTGHGRFRETVTARAIARHGRPGSRDFGSPVVPMYGQHGAAVRRTLPLALAR